MSKSSHGLIKYFRVIFVLHRQVNDMQIRGVSFRCLEQSQEIFVIVTNVSGDFDLYLTEKVAAPSQGRIYNDMYPSCGQQFVGCKDQPVPEGLCTASQAVEVEGSAG